MTYSLGVDDLEIRRLDQQADRLEEPTRLLLRMAGIERGMRVLDLGTGLGHVAFTLADMVGSTGQVVGLDSAERMVAAASRRANGRSHVRFTQGDVRSWRCDEPFDAVVGRLILFHMPEPVAVVQHHLTHLRAGGRFIAVDFDVGSCRTEPPSHLFDPHLQHVVAAFRSAGAHPMIGARLALILADAGLAGTQSVGVQGYIAPDDPRGAAMLADVVRSLAPQMAAAGIATPAELGLDTLQQRLEADMHATQSVVLPPTLVGAWGQRLVQS